MHQSAFLKIKYEFTTVRYMVNGLVGYPNYREVSRVLRLAGLRDSVKLLYLILLEEEAVLELKNKLHFLHHPIYCTMVRE